MKPWIDNFYENLHSSEIDYFSYSFYTEDHAQISFANHDLWMKLFVQRYSTQFPPVKKYIFDPSQACILWSDMTLDPLTQAYLKERNDIVGVKENISLIHRKGPNLAVMTFGSPLNKEDLLNFIDRHHVMIDWAFSRLQKIIYA